MTDGNPRQFFSELRGLGQGSTVPTADLDYRSADRGVRIGMVLRRPAASGDRYGRGMEWVQLENSEVTEYGSCGVRISEAARLEQVEGVAVHLAQIAPGGMLGRHPTRLWQLFAVTSGAGWVCQVPQAPALLRRH